MFMDANLRAAKLTNPDARFVAIAVNTKALGEDEAKSYLQKVGAEHGLPAVDPVRDGVDRIIDALA